MSTRYESVADCPRTKRISNRSGFGRKCSGKCSYRGGIRRSVCYDWQRWFPCSNQTGRVAAWPCRGRVRAQRRHTLLVHIIKRKRTRERAKQKSNLVQEFRQLVARVASMRVSVDQARRALGHATVILTAPRGGSRAEPPRGARPSCPKNNIPRSR
jgi:hypothetical protein